MDDRSPQQREQDRLEREQLRTDVRPRQVPPRGSTAVIPAVLKRRVVGGVAAVMTLLTVWILLSLYQPFAGDGDSKRPVTVVIPKGAGIDAIADTLVAKGVASSKFFLKLRIRLASAGDELKAGRYKLHRDTSYAAVIAELKNGPSSNGVTLVIPEGKSRYEVQQLTSQAGIIGDYEQASTTAAAKFSLGRYGAPSRVRNLEGFLFPATYDLAGVSTVDDLVAQQLRAFRANIGQVSMRRARSKNLTVFDVVTIASLVEREAQVASERKLIAAVIYNRLRNGIALGIDATSRYETRNWMEPLTNSVLLADTPYNTRRRRGLPPGPIGNPGLASLKAAAHPAQVGSLYYVANPCQPGSHVFSSTQAQFERDVARYNDARARAGGKQPQGC